MKLYNTLTRKKEIFKPISQNQVGLYTCGPTVYNFAHIGNLRTYIFEDILRRILEYNGYKVKHVENITDVGHLTSDSDTGEDKMEKGALREKKSVWQIASYYTKAFKDDLIKLNIQMPDIWCKATDYIEEQIELVKVLEKKGFTYIIEDGVYFDTSKLSDYGKLARLDKQGLKAGARVEIVKGKKSPTDFALWKFSYLNGRSFDSAHDDTTKRRQMEWNSPWGIGFPGWAIECSAMSLKCLGNSYKGKKIYSKQAKTIDLHCGGVDHIPVHHTNEIAQSETATGKKFVNFWLHGEFLNIDSEKMAKSSGDFTTLRTLERKGYNPLAFRYLVLGTHYRQKLGFSWKSLEAAQKGLAQIYGFLYNMFLQERKFSNKCTDAFSKYLVKQTDKFNQAIGDDLNTPRALAVVFEIIEEAHRKYNQNKSFCRKCLKKFEETMLVFDKVLGLKFEKYLKKGKKEEVPKKVKDLVTQREAIRIIKDFSQSDKIRKKIEKLGYQVEDTINGPKIKRIL